MTRSLVTFRNLTMGVRFFSRLPFYLNRPLALNEASERVRDALARREESFLTKMGREVYDYPPSPYRPLLQRAGCELGDLRKSVRTNGLEGTLKALFREGVYLSVDEFKGRTPVMRGGQAFEFRPELLCNPSAAYHLSASTGGSRSAGTPVLIDLRFVRSCAARCCLYFAAQGGLEWAKATWEVPGGGARFRLAKFAGFGKPPERWFSQLDPEDRNLHPVFRWNTSLMHWSSRLGGVPLPAPVHAPLTDPRVPIDWIVEVLRAGRVPHIFTFPSSGVALCRSAAAAGIDIGGARFTFGGEPITAARLSTVSGAGCRALPRYGSVECGPIGYGCLSPEHPDEVHLLSDLHAVIQAGDEGRDAHFPENALLITALDPYSPFTLLNVSMGDQASIGDRDCGCPLQALGWTRHFHATRSYEKLTGGGMTFLGTDVIPLLEEVLPHRFGGVPTDYQICEEESEDGQPIIRLLVHPRVGAIDCDQVAEAFLSGLGAGSATNKLMERMWRESGLLRVERRAPYTTRSGKVLHFHLLSSHSANRR